MSIDAIIPLFSVAFFGRVGLVHSIRRAMLRSARLLPIPTDAEVKGSDTRSRNASTNGPSSLRARARIVCTVVPIMTCAKHLRIAQVVHARALSTH